ncbi:hypothetical protein [Endothiovibrio diazotrophicus]
MLALLLASLAVFFTAVAQGQVSALHAAAAHDEAAARAVEVRRVASAVEAYRQANGSYPASLAVLMATADATQLRYVDPEAVRYAVAGGLSDGVWRFERAGVYALDPTKGNDASAFLSGNTCGDGTFTTATDWCGGDDAHWWRGESRADAPTELAEQRLALTAPLRRIADYHTAHGEFPTGVAVGGVATLPALAGYSGTASGCTGIHLWDGLPLGCDDLHNRQGHPITVNLRDEGALRVLYLVARTDLLSVTGTPIRVAARLAVER